MTKEEILQLANQVKAQEQLVQKLEQASFWTKLFRLKKEKNKLLTLNELFDLKLRKFLIEYDAEFSDLAAQNMELLTTDHIIYKTVTYTYTPWGTYASYLKGKIDQQGYAHCYTQRTNLGVYPLAKYDYILRYSGQVDYLGNVVLKATKIGSNILFSRPRKYVGYVNSQGIIQLSVVRKEIELTTGHVVIGKLIGQHFDDPVKTEKFNQNRQRLLKIFNRYKVQLLTP